MMYLGGIFHAVTVNQIVIRFKKDKYNYHASKHKIIVF